MDMFILMPLFDILQPSTSTRAVVTFLVAFSVLFSEEPTYQSPA
jgi:hypothetical protein